MALFARCVLAELDMFMGCPEGAIARLEPYHATFAQTGWLAGLSHLAEAHLLAGESVRAREIVENEIAVMMRRVIRREMDLVLALRVRGMVLSQRDCWEEAIAAFDGAVSHGRRLSYSWFLARTLYDYGLMDTRMGETQRGRGHLEEAMSLFRRLGARAYERRTEQTLTDAGHALSRHERDA
jgi:tetratricopeptide (TPR) repeat protein